MTDSEEHAALLQRNRRTMDALADYVPEGFDTDEKLVYLSRPAFNRTGFMVGQRSLDYAFILLETGRDADLACDIIDRCLEYQDLRDPASPTYGNFFWFTGWTEVNDPNAVSFMAPHLARIWNRHRAKLREATACTLEARFPLVLNGLMRQPWCHWAYTNIFLLTTAGRLMVSAITGDDDARAETLRQWDEWTENTARSGIPEFNSPTYAAVDIFSLLDLHGAAPDERVRGQVERALEYFFLELFLHYHAHLGILTGAFSRAYDDEAGSGLRLHGPIEAICHHQLGTPLDEPGRLSLSLALSDYLAPRWIRELALDKPFPLTVEATTSSRKGSWVRRNFLHREYTVGTASNSYYGILQVPVFAACRTPSGTRTIYTRCDPELGTCYADQVEDSVLAAFCYNFADDRPRYRLSGLETRQVSVRLQLGRIENPGDVTVAAAAWTGETMTFASGTPVLLRVGDVRIGVVPIVGRVSIGDDDPVRLVADDEGTKLEIRIYEGGEPAETAFPRAQAGFYLRVTEDALDISKVVLTDTFEADTWHLSAVDGERTLAVRAPLSAENIFPSGPQVGAHPPEAGWLLRAPGAALRAGELFRTRSLGA